MKIYTFHIHLIVSVLITNISVSFAQTTFLQDSLTQQLDELSQAIPGLNEKTTLSLRDVPLHEYVRAIGLAHQVNLFIEDTPSLRMTHNLKDEPVKSVIRFVCEHFHYKITVVGTIINFIPAPLPTPKVPLPVAKVPDIQFAEGKLSMDLKADSLYQVIRAISALTGHKVIARAGTDRLVQLYLPPTELPLALKLLAEANDLALRQTRKGYFVLDGRKHAPTEQAKGTSGGHFAIEAFEDGNHRFVQMEAQVAALGPLVQALFEEAQADFLVFGELEGTVSLQVEAMALDQVLQYLFQGTDFTYRIDGDLYLIGPKELPGLQKIEIVKLRYRPTDQALSLIPGGKMENQPRNSRNPSRPSSNRQNGNNSPFPTSQHQAAPSQQGSYFGESQAARMTVRGVELIEYPELNRIILKGPTDEVEALKSFLQEIDRPIPMVKVEMIVVEVNKNQSLQTGIQAGIGGGSDTTGTNLFPSLSTHVNGPQVNGAIQASGIPFLQSLGTLSPNFYVNLQAQEARGDVQIRMRPVLSMLNGREASLTIGQTQYYLLETTTNSSGAVNNFQQFSQQFTEIEANVTLTIRPFISEDNMVTLDVAPDFSTPVGAFTANTPPTIATRRFDSSIRVKNGETFVLGGLTQEEHSRNTSGLPLLSRLPILKWLLGNNQRSNSESSLMIYITPIIYYH